MSGDRNGNREPGLIRNEDRIKQVVSFKGLQWGREKNIYPTDIDGLLEFRNRLTIFIETKTRNECLLGGQKKALEVCCNDIRKSGKPCYVIVTEHDIPPEREIVLAETIAREIFNGKWVRIIDDNYLLIEVINILLMKHKLDNL